MDRKIKLVMLTSLVAVMATGCSNYRGIGGGQGANSSTVNNGSGTVRTGQVAGGNRVFGQNRPVSNATCSPCASNTTGQQQSSYTYKPATTKPAVNTNTGTHSQQWYQERWKRQQQQGGQQNTNYTGYGSTDTNYVDYTSGSNNNATSNKSIYTGSYQQQNTYKPYKPTTYSGGSSATTNTASTYSGAAATGGSTYTVKKGDTVFEVMRQTGVYWKDIISMNNLVAPAYTISPGQRLKLK